MDIEKAKVLANKLKGADSVSLEKVLNALEADAIKLKMDIGGMHTKYDSDFARPLVEQLQNIMELISVVKIMKANA